MNFDIEKVAVLARLNLKAEEKERLSRDLENILNYVKSLEKLDTAAVEPTSHVLNLENVYRKDIPQPSEVRDQVLKHAPLSEGKFFKVPKVVERES
jgi:aspartyl-tRNA(Asn)/glutamyl-tRNA(Gln) amidotransferase subunit C